MFNDYKMPIFSAQFSEAFGIMAKCFRELEARLDKVELRADTIAQSKLVLDSACSQIQRMKERLDHVDRGLDFEKSSRAKSHLEFLTRLEALEEFASKPPRILDCGSKQTNTVPVLMVCHSTERCIVVAQNKCRIKYLEQQLAERDTRIASLRKELGEKGLRITELETSLVFIHASAKKELDK